MRLSILATVLASVALTVGCDKAIDDQTKVDNSLAEANNKINAANKEAEQKGLAAQAEADKKIADANANFMKLREDYRHATSNHLVDLDRKVELLEATSRAATGKTKSDLEFNVKQIHAKRAEFATDYKTIESATAMTWDDAKTRLDKELSDLNTLVDKAS